MQNCSEEWTQNKIFTDTHNRNKKLGTGKSNNMKNDWSELQTECTLIQNNQGNRVFNATDKALGDL